jgi:hypothetical protein
VVAEPKAAGKVVYLGACFIAAVFLAQEEDFKSSPRIVFRIAQSVRIAREVYERFSQDYPEYFVK